MSVSRLADLSHVLSRQFSTTVLHGALSTRISSLLDSRLKVDPKLKNQYVVASGEVGYAVHGKQYALDVGIYPIETISKDKISGEHLTPRETPPPQLLIEVMSDSNLTADGKRDLSQKIIDSLNSGCKAVWLVYNSGAPFDRNAVGVQQFHSADEVKFLKKPLSPPDAELDDGLGLSSRIKAKEICEL